MLGSPLGYKGGHWQDGFFPFLSILHIALVPHL
jgi:hypothetical protein